MRNSGGGPPAEERHEFPGPDRSWDAEWADFIGAIQKGTTGMANAEDGLAALRLVEAVYDCAARTRASREGETK